MNIKALQTFLDNHEIPRIKKKPKTFLGISKQPHFENVLSNIYAFYFNVNEEHGMGDLFLKSLIECIEISELKDRDFSGFKDFDIETEYYTEGIGLTGKKGFIDLLLYNNSQAIIIENKVNHHLDNDLDDYWNSIKLDNKEKIAKIGILLSLKPISKDNYEQYACKDDFINFTHQEFLKRVMINSGEYLVNAKDKYIVFLKDLAQNILNISRPTMSEKNIEFYIENKSKINQLVSFKYSFKKHIINEVENAGNYINNVKLVIPRSKSFNYPRLRYYESTKKSELVYTIVFEKLLMDENFLHIIVEPIGRALREGAVFRNIKFDSKEKLVLKDSFYSKTDEGWAHFASKCYDLKSEDIADLGTFIQKKIKEDHFDTIMKKLEDHLLNPAI